MRNKKTITISICLLVTALFIGTAFSPATAVYTEEPGQTQYNPNTEIDCIDAILAAAEELKLEILDILDDLTPSDVIEMVISYASGQELLELLYTVANVGIRLLNAVETALINLGIAATKVAQLMQKIIQSEFVQNIVLPLANFAVVTFINWFNDYLEANYPANSPGGSLVLFLFAVGLGLVNLATIAGEMFLAFMSVVGPWIYDFFMNYVIPVGIDIGQYLWEKFCELFVDCEPDGGNTDEETAPEMEEEPIGSIPSDPAGADATSSSSSTTCIECAAAASATTDSSAMASR